MHRIWTKFDLRVPDPTCIETQAVKLQKEWNYWLD